MRGMDREEKAESLFRSGMCCSQAAFGAFAEDFGMDAETAAKVSAGLGGGVGRMREVCGAVTGATLALGMKFGPDKAAVYPHVQALCEKFRAECGSIVCRELLAGADPHAAAAPGGAPEARSGEYYRKRPCVELVRLAVRLCEEEMRNG